MWSVTGLLDQRGVQVDTTLELPRAGPASGALVLTGSDGPRAGNAADRRVAAVVQRVIGDLVDVDVGLDALRVPVDERLDLPDGVALRPLHLLGIGAGLALLAADARDPGVVLGQGALERLDLADVATAVGVGLPQAVGWVERAEGLQGEAVALDETVAGLVGLWEEDLGIELDDRDLQAELADHVHEHGALSLPRARQAHAVAELLVAPEDRLLGAHRLDVRKPERRRGRQAAPP